MLLRSLLSYLFTPIHTVESPLELDYFRPISLLDSMYKLVAKILVARLVGVMGKLISPEQLTFVKGRKLVDGVMALNEVINFSRKYKRECLIVKVDIEKSYDLVSWSFLNCMIKRFGFDVKWRG